MAVCPCGRVALPDDHLCSRCRYYQTVFNPPFPVFENKRDRALRAIELRKVMKKSIRVVDVE